MNTISKITTVALLLGSAGVAFAQTPPTTTVGIMMPSAVSPGTGKTIATITASALSGATLSSLLLSFGYSEGTTGANLTNCAINAGSATSNTFVVPGSSDIPVTFGSPVSVTGTLAMSLVCDVPTTIPNGSALAIALVPQATASTNIVVSGTGSALTTFSSSAAGPTTGTGGGTATPGVPNTGVGGSAATTWVLLILSGLAALAGATYLARMRRA